MVREKTGREKTEGKRRSRKRQQETGRRDRLPRSFQKQCFQFNGMALGANVTWAKAAEALTLSRARAHTHPYIIYLFIHNRYKCLSETRKGINSYWEGSGQGRRRRTGHGARGMFSMQQEGGLAHPTLKNIHLPHGIILMR